MLLAPICSATNETMFCRYTSSASDQVRGRVECGDDETVLGDVVEQRKVVANPVAVRAAAVQAQNGRHRLALLEIIGIVEEERSPRLRGLSRSPLSTSAPPHQRRHSRHRNW